MLTVRSGNPETRRRTAQGAPSRAKVVKYDEMDERRHRGRDMPRSATPTPIPSVGNRLRLEHSFRELGEPVGLEMWPLILWRELA